MGEKGEGSGGKGEGSGGKGGGNWEWGTPCPPPLYNLIIFYDLLWQPEFQSNQPKNLMKPFSLSDDALPKM